MKIIKRFAPLLLAVVLVFGSCLSVSASADFIYPKEFESLGFDCIIYGKDWYSLITSSAPLYYDKQNNNSTNNRMVYDEGTQCIEYFSRSLDFSDCSGSAIQPWYSSDTYYGYYSTYDIYYLGGETIFFQKTPLNPVESVEVLPVMIAPQIQTILTIAVSLLALLMGLVMLRKKLPIFLRS